MRVSARPVMNSHFRNAFANWFAIAKVATLGAVDSYLHTPNRLPILQTGEPIVKHLCCLNGVHAAKRIIWDTCSQLFSAEDFIWPSAHRPSGLWQLIENFHF